jgi:S1-C subfamily serine protease
MKTLIQILAVWIALGLAPLFGQSPKMIREIRNKTVGILTLDEKGKMIRYGSGFIIGNRGEIATNHHVIEGAHSAKVKLFGSENLIPVQSILHLDEGHDLAVVRADTKLSPLWLGDDSAAEVGGRILAFGNPRGLEGTVSNGIVSAFRKVGSNFNVPLENGSRVVQITAAISSGSSGGPVVDGRGRVIAITVASRNTGQNLNFAIPVSSLKNLLRSKKLNMPLAIGGKSRIDSSAKAGLKGDLEIVKVGTELEWVSVVRDGSKVYEHTGSKSKVVNKVKSLTPFVVIERKRVGSKWMVLVGKYVRKQEAQKIGWMRAADLL